MGDVVNLNRYRKNLQKNADDITAATNRTRHGRTKAERQQEIADKDRRTRMLDGQKLDDPA